MFVPESCPRRLSLAAPVALVFLSALLCLCAPSNLFAQSAANYEAEKQRALKLLEDGKATAALPIFERLSDSNPEDGQVMFYFGFAVLSHAQTLTDPNAQAVAHPRARRDA